jgi:hypothetical protein
VIPAASVRGMPRRGGDRWLLGDCSRSRGEKWFSCGDGDAPTLLSRRLSPEHAQNDPVQNCGSANSN